RLPDSIRLNDPVGSATPFMLRADGTYLIAPVTAIIRRCTLDLIGGFQYVPNLCTTDFPTFLRLTRVGKFYFIPEIMGYYRRHVSGSLRSADRMRETLLTLIPSLLREFGAELTPDQLRAIEKSWKASHYMHACERGRIHLLRKEWRESRLHFRGALNASAP